MSDNNIVVADFDGRRTVTTEKIFQYDYGMILQISGIELPSAFEAHFCNAGDTETLGRIGQDNEVIIPSIFLRSGENIEVFIYLHTGEDDGETVYTISIPVTKRPEPTDETPTPVEQSEITQAIAALNAGVQQAEHYADLAESYNVRVSVSNNTLFLTTGGD